MDDREKTWQGLRAASLSIVPGVGHLYLEAKRGYWLCAVAITLIVVWKLFWPPAQVFYVILAIFSAVDAYGIAKRGRGLL